MSKDVSFVLDQTGGQDILQKMSASLVKRSADAIAGRARSMAGSLTSNPPTITVETRIGTIKRGVRAIATVKAEGQDSHANYIGHVALAKAKDAGRV
jgi:hypothetical protein